jgi:TPR repeat protein
MLPLTRIRAAAQQGNTYAQVSGVAEDDTEAVKWYYEAACRGRDAAFMDLHACYVRRERRA